MALAFTSRSRANSLMRIWLVSVIPLSISLSVLHFLLRRRRLLRKKPRLDAQLHSAKFAHWLRLRCTVRPQRPTFRPRPFRARPLRPAFPGPQLPRKLTAQSRPVVLRARPAEQLHQLAAVRAIGNAPLRRAEFFPPSFRQCPEWRSILPESYRRAFLRW